MISTGQVGAAGTLLQGHQEHVHIGFGSWQRIEEIGSESLEVGQGPRPCVHRTMQTREADAKVPEGECNVAQKSIPLAEHDALGLAKGKLYCLHCLPVLQVRLKPRLRVLGFDLMQELHDGAQLGSESLHGP